MKNILFMVFVAALAASISFGSDPNVAREASDSNNTANQALINVAHDPNNPQDGYISGDAFNLAFSKLFKEYVNENGLVNYAKLRRMRLELFRAARKLNDLKPEVYLTWSKKDKIAFWINAYNLCTLDGIIKNYPIEPSRFKLFFYPANSVAQISGLTNKTYFNIMGIQYTLDEIERDILIGRFQYPRVCLAICHGTVSSAPLRNEPFVGKFLDKQLNDQAEKFFSNSNNFRIDTLQKTVYITGLLKMYQWRKDFFVKSFDSRKIFRQYDEPEKAFLGFAVDYISKANAELLKRSNYTVEYTRYNWLLNEQSEK